MLHAIIRVDFKAHKNYRFFVDFQLFRNEPYRFVIEDRKIVKVTRARGGLFVSPSCVDAVLGEINELMERRNAGWELHNISDDEFLRCLLGCCDITRNLAKKAMVRADVDARFESFVDYSFGTPCLCYFACKVHSLLHVNSNGAKMWMNA